MVGSLHSDSDVEARQIVPFLFIQWGSGRKLSWEREEEIHEFSYINVFITCILCLCSKIQNIFGYSKYLWIPLLIYKHNFLLFLVLHRATYQMAIYFFLSMLSDQGK